MLADLKKKQKAEMIESTAENITKLSAKNKLKKDVKSDESDYIADERSLINSFSLLILYRSFFLISQISN